MKTVNRKHSNEIILEADFKTPFGNLFKVLFKLPFSNLLETQFSFFFPPFPYQLSQYFQPMIKKLLETTDRADSSESNLRAASYEAIMEMIKNSPDDCYNCVLTTTSEIMKRIDQLLNVRDTNLSSSQRSQYADLQSLH